MWLSFQQCFILVLTGFDCGGGQCPVWVPAIVQPLQDDLMSLQCCHVCLQWFTTSTFAIHECKSTCKLHGVTLRSRRAQEIEPSYCEPSYWIALTRINQGDVKGGLSAMKSSLTCKYTAAEALQTLNRLYLLMHEAAQTDTTPMVVSRPYKS